MRVFRAPFVVAAAAGLLQCAQGEAPPRAVAPQESTFLHDPRPLRFRSARFELSIPLPDGHGWRIDDHSGPLLVATHRATASTLTLGTFALADLGNRDRCEAAARERRLVPQGTLSAVEQAVTVGPGAYDTRVLVALETRRVQLGNPRGLVVGHVFLFGAYVRKCLFVHYETPLAEPEDEAMLSSRLAVARIQILGGITLEPFDQPAREREAPPPPVASSGRPR